MNQHWMNKMIPPYNLFGHKNPIRVSAEVIAKLMKLKSEMEGTNKTIYEEALIAEEKNEQYP